MKEKMNKFLDKAFDLVPGLIVFSTLIEYPETFMALPIFGKIVMLLGLSVVSIGIDFVVYVVLDVYAKAKKEYLDSRRESEK